ncbi:MAG TPA: alpha/beta fold hydrolase [Terriglobales bacterium]
MPELDTAEQAGAILELAKIAGTEEGSVTLDGVRWRYLHAGSGPPLLLIHGFMAYSFSWRFNMEALSRHFSVYAIDLPGCGFSQRTDEPQCSLASDAEGVLRFMEYFGMEQADVLGTSRGGGVAIVLATLAAQRSKRHLVRRLLLVCPINPWSSHGRLLTRLLATALGGFAVTHILPRLPGVMLRYFRRLYGDPSRIAPGSIEGYKAGLDVPGSFKHMLRIVRSWHCDLTLIEESLPAIGELPTLLLWGSRDTAVYASSAYALQSRLKNSALVMLDGVGHVPYEEVPEEFNRVICDFLLHDTPPTPLETAPELPTSSQVSSVAAPLKD